MLQNIQDLTSLIKKNGILKNNNANTNANKVENSFSNLQVENNSTKSIGVSEYEIQEALETANSELSIQEVDFKWPWQKEDDNKDDNNSKDGIIGNSKQRATGDCWLLSAVNSLSYTSEGQKAIKEALDYQENGDTVVHLKGVGDYTVTKDEFDKIRNEQANGNRQYSVGDDDMLIMELAIEKVMKDMANGNFQFKSGLGFENSTSIQGDIYAYDSAIWDGLISQGMYLITGKPSSEVHNTDEINQLLDKFDGVSLSLGASVNIDKTVKDINGNDVTLNGPHAYAVKSVDDNAVTIINPWDSSKEIVLDRKTFLDEIGDVTYCDLNAESVDYIRYPDFIDENGNKTYLDECIQEDWMIYSNAHGDRIYPKYSYKIYDAYGLCISNGHLDENRNKITEIKCELNSDGKPYISEKIDYFQDGKKGISTKYDEEYNATSYQMYEFELNGEWKVLQGISSKEHMNTIYERKLLDYSQFDVIEVWNLGKFSDVLWSEALEILEQNPNATYSEICELIKNKSES